MNRRINPQHRRLHKHNFILYFIKPLFEVAAGRRQQQTLTSDRLVVHGETSRGENVKHDSNDIEGMVEMFVQNNQNNDVELLHVLKFIESNMAMKFHEESSHYKNDSFKKFQFKFFMAPELVERFINILSSVITQLENCEKVLVEVPLSTQKSFMKNQSIARMKANHDGDNILEDFETHRFTSSYISFGTLINMSKYFQEYEFTAERGHPPIVFKQIAVNGHRDQIELFVYSHETSSAYRLVWRSSTIRSIVYENHTTFERVYFEMTVSPKIYSQKCTEEQFAEILEEGHPDMERRSTFEALEESILGMANSICVDFVKDHQSVVQMLFYIVDKVKQLEDRHILLYLTKIHVKRTLMNFSEFTNMLDLYDLPFDLHYACMVMFKKNFKTIYLLSDQKFIEGFFELLKNELNKKNASEDCVRQLEGIIYTLHFQINEGLFVNIHDQMIKCLKNPDIYRFPRKGSNYIWKVLLSPTHWEYLPPISSLESRFTKMALADHTLRIQLAEDGGFQFGNGTLTDRRFSTKKIMLQIVRGIKIKRRLFEFLGSSSSQMREFSATLYAKDDKGMSSRTLRGCTGIQKQNPTPSKFISRFGLFFSQSLAMFPLEENIEVVCLPDIEGGIKRIPEFALKDSKTRFPEARYCISDGIGYVHSSVADIFIKKLSASYNLNGYTPSAFQIRFAGCKGVLSTHLDAEPNKVFFRQSMKKFDSDCRQMALLKYSYPRRVCLNRPFIMILDDGHRVPQREFYKLFEDSTQDLLNAMTSEAKAKKFVQQFSQSFLPWSKIARTQISILKEPFLRAVLEYLIHYRLNFELKKKARCPISPKCGRLALGILDETKTLQHNQIFFQATRMDDDNSVHPSETTILTGRVMITRFPCMQRGDVRLFTAVDVPALRHIKDCVVFPATVIRSHADEMSGGDLDGDEFGIFWNNGLVVNRNYEPMDFPYGQSMNVSKAPLDNEALIKFYMEYFEKQEIGCMANQHLRIADFKGLNDVLCDELAYNYNIMLDSGKTGYFDCSKVKFRPRNTPDFMASSSSTSQYLSNKMLGQFYRQCSLIEEVTRISHSKIDSSPLEGNYSSEDGYTKQYLSLPGWRVLKKPANEAFQRYKMRIQMILHQAKIDSEAQLFSDCFENNDESISAVMENLFDEFRNLFEQQLKNENLSKMEDGRLYLASAWYSICYDEESQEFHNFPLMGLPWLIHQDIIELAATFDDLKMKNECLEPISNDRKLTLDSFKEFDVKSYEFGYTRFQIRKLATKTYCWNFDSIRDDIEEFDPKNLQTFRKLALEATEKIVFNLVSDLFKKIRDDIYSYRYYDEYRAYQHRLVTYKGLQVIDSDLVDSILKVRIKRFLADLSELSHDSLPTVTSLLNLLFAYLNQILLNVNACIEYENIEELFLLKYAVFALVFINKLGIKHDQTFYNSFNFEFKRTHDMWSRMLVNDQPFKAKILDEFVRHGDHFKKALDEIYQSEILANNNIDTNRERFFLLPRSVKLDHNNLLKFKLLAGTFTGKFYSQGRDKGNNAGKFVSNGYYHSLYIARLLIGHPKISQTLKLFSIQ